MVYILILKDDWIGLEHPVGTSVRAFVNEVVQVKPIVKWTLLTFKWSLLSATTNSI